MTSHSSGPADITGASATPSGSRATHEAPAGLHPTGFDPSRWRANSYEGKPRHLPKAELQELDKLLRAARAHIDSLTPYRREVLAKAARSVSPVNCGWQQYALAEAFVYELHASAIETGTAETEGLGPKDESASDAQPPSPNQSRSS